MRSNSKNGNEEEARAITSQEDLQIDANADLLSEVDEQIERNSSQIKRNRRTLDNQIAQGDTQGSDPKESSLDRFIRSIALARKRPKRKKKSLDL